MRFLLDAMLGKLARDLRALGYDAAYENDAEDDALLERARRSDRLLITRDVALADEARDDGVLLEHRDPAVQLANLVEHLELEPDPEAFLSRCLDCNEPLQEAHVPKALPPDREGAPHWSCPGCGNVYWIGTHAHAMLDRLAPYFDETPSLLQDPS